MNPKRSFPVGNPLLIYSGLKYGRYAYINALAIYFCFDIADI